MSRLERRVAILEMRDLEARDPITASWGRLSSPVAGEMLDQPVHLLVAYGLV